MLIEEYINTIEEAPKAVQKILSAISEIEKSVAEEKHTLDTELDSMLRQIEDEKQTKTAGLTREEIDKRLQVINRCYLKVLDADKKKLSLVTVLQGQLEEGAMMIKEFSTEFKEKVSKNTLFLKLGSISDMLESQMDVDCSEEDSPTCCMCKSASKGEMAICDNQSCPIGWYHCACVGLKSSPRKRWLCSLCEKD